MNHMIYWLTKKIYIPLCVSKVHQNYTQKETFKDRQGIVINKCMMSMYFKKIKTPILGRHYIRKKKKNADKYIIRNA